MKRLGIIILFMTSLILSCSRISVFDGFSNITETDSDGFLTSTQDETDWNINDDFNKNENALFDQTYEDYCSYDLNDYNIIGFPNPVSSTDLLILHFEIPEGKSISFRMVDRNYETLVSKDYAERDTWINLEGLGISEQTVRVYYKIYGEDCELKGHGDIQVN